MSSQRVGKYACLEIERRYLLKNVPPDVDTNAESWQILDRYLPGTHLRLRCMQNSFTNETINKFTQKFVPDLHEPAKTNITNLYLTQAEYESLASLPAQVVEKTRYKYVLNGQQYSLDVFQGRHRGLVLAEIEFENEVEMQRFPVPEFAIKDVTDEPFFSGGHLAAVSQKTFEEDLARFFNSV